MSLGKAVNGIAYVFEWLDCMVETGGSLTRRLKVPFAATGRGTLTNK